MPWHRRRPLSSILLGPLEGPLLRAARTCVPPQPGQSPLSPLAASLISSPSCSHQLAVRRLYLFVGLCHCHLISSICFKRGPIFLRCCSEWCSVSPPPQLAHLPQFHLPSICLPSCHPSDRSRLPSLSRPNAHMKRTRNGMSRRVDAHCLLLAGLRANCRCQCVHCGLAP